ncbi:MAG: SpoIIE family protein phosphatase, partial [Anaerolineales bacterium]|nr:SpoIIE family protein phosphatase [Anaerolineales bacterium]
DLQTNTIVITRNNPVPMFISRGEQIDCLGSESQPIGVSLSVRPVISEIAVEIGLTIVLFTDGLTHAGERRGQPIDVCTSLKAMLEDQDPSPQGIADALLGEAVQLDDGRPSDDISVVVLKVLKRRGDDVRRMTVRLPINVG